ncbi:MAG: AAA family ATPase [Bacilli bacterium]|nr:AAA family ATPase [Bacilli bacterium]
MIIAKNQKGMKKLEISEQLKDKILNMDNKIILFYGSNGRGKSTLKDLLINKNLSKNFDMQDEEQFNEIYNIYNSNDLCIFDDKFINNFIYLNDSLQKNQSKIIFNSPELEEQINNINITKDEINQVLSKINQLNTIFDEIEKAFDFSTTGTVTPAKKRFATTFLQGNLPLSYDDIFNINNEQHKNWWYQGLYLYKSLNMDYCPWCKNIIDNISDDIKRQISGVNSVSPIHDKLFSDKVTKKDRLSVLLEEEKINSVIKDEIQRIISLIDDSIEINKEDEIINLMRQVKTKYEYDKVLIEETILDLKKFNEIDDIEGINIENKFLQFEFFDVSSNYIQTIINDINNVIQRLETLKQAVIESNNQLISLIGNKENSINHILERLGLNYKIEVDKNEVIKNGINDNSEYIFLKSKNDIDVTNNVANTLSYGEKSTLAFAFFIQIILSNGNTNKVIIIDDPISSYDIFRRYTSVDILRSLGDATFKKMFLLTHELDFVSSVVKGFRGYLNTTPLILVETNDSEIEIMNLEDNYLPEIDLYKNILSNSNGHYSIVQRAIAFRQLYELYKYINKLPSNMPIYKYVCKLVHYRKDESTIGWNNDYIDDIRKIFEYFGLNYDNTFESIQDESAIFLEIENLYSTIVVKNAYQLSIEELCCLRTIAEYAVRTESISPNRFRKSMLSMWKITDSIKEKRLEEFKTLLNAIMHSDDDEIYWTKLSLNEYKAIPKYVIQQIIDIL